MSEIKYSVIIPVYNAENTIERCLDSLLNQKRDDVQIIIVNDGSTDKSQDILSRKYSDISNIVVINKENSGVSSARNTGLNEAKGKYITFVDSDDYVSDNFFSSFDNALDNTDYDYLIFSLYVGASGKFIVKEKTPFSSENAAYVFKKIAELISNKQINAPYPKLYKKELIDKNSIVFTQGTNIAEDRAFNIKYSLCIKSIMVSSSPIYYVCTDNQDSLSRKKDRDLTNQFEIADNDIRQAIDNSTLEDEYKSKIKDALNFCKYRNVYSEAKRDRIAGKSRRERLAKIRRSSKMLRKKKLSYPNTRYCKLICIPVKLGLTCVIDLVSWKLAK